MMAERDESYDASFYERRHSRTEGSADAVLTEVFGLGRFESVVDVGCGVGTWLAACARHGVRDILGLEGSWLPVERLVIPREQFRHCDLNEPIRLSREFDLAISLEVAEHLAADKAASFIESLTRLAPVVLFSAAVPFQGGVHHLNEKWPEYWIELFGKHGYEVADPIRSAIWNNANVRPWYAQNAFVFLRMEAAQRWPLVAQAVLHTDRRRLAVVHPALYSRNSDPRMLSLSTLLSVLPGAAVRALRRRLPWRRAAT
jgi:SAM-dependent methyltransferase